MVGNLADSGFLDSGGTCDLAEFFGVLILLRTLHMITDEQTMLVCASVQVRTVTKRDVR